MAGSTLDARRKNQIVHQLHQFTGLKVGYLKKADLRVNGSEFEKNLLTDSDQTTGRLDSRFAGPTIDPLSKGAQYDPQSSSIGSAYVSAFNHYLRTTLKFGGDTHYRAVSRLFTHWNFNHQQPNTEHSQSHNATNVMPDLANAMKTNPNLQVMLNGGYFDLATPFYAAIHEMHHLPMPDKLQKNISYHFYQSGHMVYAHIPALNAMHRNVAAFIARTDNLGGSIQESGPKQINGEQQPSEPDKTGGPRKSLQGLTQPGSTAQ